MPPVVIGAGIAAAGAVGSAIGSVLATRAPEGLLRGAIATVLAMVAGKLLLA